VECASERSGIGPSPARLAELVGALSLGIDLGFGQPMEHVLRACLISLRIADVLDLADPEREVVYYAGLLVNVGCHTDAHEQAKWFGDDIAMKSQKYDYPPRSVRGGAAVFRLIGRGNPPLHRFRLGLSFAVSGFKDVAPMISRHAAIAQQLALELQLRDDVVTAIGQSYEYWDGHGWPNGLKGEAIALAARIVGIAEYVEVAHRLGGVEAVRNLAQDRRGKQFDPALADLIHRHADQIFSGLDDVATWATVVEGEPALTVALNDDELDAALLSIASFVDLKSPYFLGHSQAVANLCDDAARRMGLPQDERRTVRRAGLVHGLGRLGISNAILDKRGPLGPAEWERVRLQPYITERMLHSSAILRPLAAIAVQHRERLDGSGYPRAASGSTIPRAARILAAADAYQAMREPRPHRSVMSAGDAASQLRDEVEAGHLDAQAVDAVLGAAGQRVPARPTGPGGLTTREVEVLRLVARGLSNREIAVQLVISPKTARNHVEHIYTKIDASSRATASLYAMQHGLLYDEDPAAPSS
jgi:HD-GYP domain-containing protein (c-di-GMP phosphodiesterase class II)